MAHRKDVAEVRRAHHGGTRLFFLCGILLLCLENDGIVLSLPDLPQSSQPTSDDVRWVQEWFEGVITRAETSYPSAAIRKLIAQGRMYQQSHHVFEGMSKQAHPAGKTVTASAFWQSNGQPTLQWYLPGVQYVFAANPGDRDQYEDVIIETFLHEMYHLSRQKSFVPGTLSREVWKERELEAWWWTLESVILPMHSVGRHDKSTDRTMILVLRAYETAHGNPNDPAWLVIGDELVPEQ